MLVLLGAIGCDSEVTVEDGTGGTTSSSSSKGASTTGVQSSSTADPCSGFADAQDGAKFVVRVHNDSGFPIYLPTLCSQPQFDITAFGGGPADTTFGYSDFCLQTCSDRQTQSTIDCAPCPPQSILLPPGGVREFEWNRTGLTTGVLMPAGCYFGSPDPSCSRIVPALPGDYSVFATGFGDCGQGNGCTCDPATGVCDGDANGGQAFSNPASFTLPADDAVDVVFGVCAFPCPNP